MYEWMQANRPGLGRHINHDPRSWAYAYEEGVPVSKRHISNTEVLNQGNLGSCTGNAATKCLSYEPFWTGDWTLDEDFAVKVYSAATRIDPYNGYYPPDDTGSDGLSVAKVLKSQNFISGYQHGFSAAAVYTALGKQPVIVGTDWYTNQFYPDDDGRLNITGQLEGGHEYVLDEVDVQNKRVWMQNSWGDGWGIEGRAYYTFDDFATLLGRGGDCVVFTPNSQPAPTPTPMTPDEEMLAATKTWLSFRHTSKVNRAFVDECKKWLATK